MIFAIVAILFLAIGIVIGKCTHKDHPAGDLRIDCSDPYENPNLFLELDTDIQTVMRKKFVIFRIRLEDYVPQK